MWAEKFVEFQDALEKLSCARCELCLHVRQGDCTEAHREHFHKAKVKVLQLFNEQLTTNQRNYESNKTS
jgi:hypothetical protein